MLNVKKEMKGSTLTAHLSGSIEETANFEDQVGEGFEELNIYCKGVNRINSLGVKGWIKYFSNLSKSGVKLKFFECSPPIVEQINLISNFVSGGEVVNFYVPYICRNCDTEMVGLFEYTEIKKNGVVIPEMSCTNCKTGKAVFDDLEEEYFSFIK